MKLSTLLFLCIGIVATQQGLCAPKERGSSIRVEENRPVRRVKKRVYRNYPGWGYPGWAPYPYYAYPWGGPYYGSGYYGPGFGFYVGF